MFVVAVIASLQEAANFSDVGKPLGDGVEAWIGAIVFVFAVVVVIVKNVDLSERERCISNGDGDEGNNSVAAVVVDQNCAVSVEIPRSHSFG